MTHRSLAMTIVAVLALFQGIFGLLRAFHWLDVGSDLLGQGLLLLPLIGFLAFFRGALVTVIALLHVLFACGVFLGWAWARWLGILVAAATLLLVVSIMMQGETPARAAIWCIVPLIMLGYLLSPAGRPVSSR